MRPLNYLLAIILLVFGSSLFAEEFAKTSNIESYSLNDARQFDKDGNHEMAVKIYRVYAEQGDDRAQFNLGVYYFDGEVVEEDLVTAYAWIKTSRTNYDPYGRESAQRGIYASLSEEDKKRADELAAEFLSRYGSGKRVALDFKVDYDFSTTDKVAADKERRTKRNLSARKAQTKKPGERVN